MNLILRPMQASGILILRTVADGTSWVTTVWSQPSPGPQGSSRLPGGTCLPPRVRNFGCLPKHSHRRVPEKLWHLGEGKKPLPRSVAQSGQLVGDGLDLVANFLNAEEGRGLVGSDQPVPECRTEIEPL